MDETINKGILIAVGVIATLIVAAIIFMGVKFGRQSAGNAFTKIGNMNSQAETEEITQYLGETVTGNQVTSLITQWSQYPVAIKVDGTSYNYTVNGKNVKRIDDKKNAENLVKAKNPEEAAYINPNGKYTVNGTADDTGAYNLIEFKRK